MQPSYASKQESYQSLRRRFCFSAAYREHVCESERGGLIAMDDYAAFSQPPPLPWHRRDSRRITAAPPRKHSQRKRAKAASCAPDTGGGRVHRFGLAWRDPAENMSEHFRCNANVTEALWFLARRRKNIFLIAACSGGELGRCRNRADQGKDRAMQMKCWIKRLLCCRGIQKSWLNCKNTILGPEGFFELLWFKYEYLRGNREIKKTEFIALEQSANPTIDNLYSN